MATKSDGTDVPHPEALIEWAAISYQKLKEVACTYNEVISYAQLSELVQTETDIRTKMLIPNWIGSVLEIAAIKAAEAAEPPLTSLCIHADGTIGDGYELAPKFESASKASDIETRAAEDRLLCYQAFATDLPGNGGTPTLTPQVELRRRKDDGEDKKAWLREIIKDGSLSIRDRIPFHDHVDVAMLFGRIYKMHQRATINLDAVTDVWFPKMYPNADWENSMSSDGNALTMSHVPGGKYGANMATKTIRKYVIVFGHIKPSSGPRYYEFLGVFEGTPRLSDNTSWVHQRVADTIHFDGQGAYSFVPSRVRPIQDDQVAEAGDTDSKIMAEAQAQLNSGDFAVEDQLGTAKSRGSYQAVFAKRVKDNYGWECAVTGIRTKEFLVASHIIPWSEDKEVRLDPTNGICLSTFVDRAFDAGYLAITPEHRTAVRWEMVEDDPILKSELSRIDDCDLTMPAAEPADPTKLARRIGLGY